MGTAGTCAEAVPIENTRVAIKEMMKGAVRVVLDVAAHAAKMVDDEFNRARANKYRVRQDIVCNKDFIKLSLNRHQLSPAERAIQALGHIFCTFGT